VWPDGVVGVPVNGEYLRGPHNIKHTLGRRLRAAGVSFEDRQDLLGHRSARITTHYSGAELQGLIRAANKVCAKNSGKTPALVLLKQRGSQAGSV